MKKTLLTITLAFIFGIVLTNAQNIKKGSIIGAHNITIKLDPDVTMNQFIDKFNNDYIPAVEKHFPGMNIRLAAGLRGENQDEMGVFYFFESEDARAKYFNDDGSWTTLGAKALALDEPYWNALTKLGTYKWTYTDWLIL